MEKEIDLNQRCWWYHDPSDSYTIMTYAEFEEDMSASCDLNFICDALDDENTEGEANKRVLDYIKNEREKAKVRNEILQKSFIGKGE